MKITHFLEKLDEAIPLSFAMPDDPVGLQVMSEDRELSVIAVVYELSGEIVRQVKQIGAELIVAFHPLIYPHLSSITGKNRVEQIVIDLIQERSGLYVLHTAFDAHPKGTSHLLAKGLGCTEVRPLVPLPENQEAGMGAIGSFNQAIDIHELARRLKETCKAAVVRISHKPAESDNRKILSIGILGGSGMSFYDAAIDAGVDAFITAEARYHTFHAANDKIPILDPGHAESEAFVVNGMADLIGEMVLDLNQGIRVVRINEPTNPIQYIV